MIELTPRQIREVNIAIRHLGRAMKALNRAKVPLDSGYTPWRYSLNKGEQRVGQASDALIDGLEALGRR